MEGSRRSHDDNFGNSKADDANFIGECRNLVQTIVECLVDDRDALNFDIVTGGRITVFSVKCARDDVGKLIGKEGRTANAMRTLLSHAAAKYDKRAMLEIIEPS